MAPLAVDILDSVEPTEWNSWVSRTAWGTIFQTTFWANRLCELWDCRPCYFVVRDAGAPAPAVVLLGFEVRSDLVAGEHLGLMDRLAGMARAVVRGRSRFQWFGQPAEIDPVAGGRTYGLLLMEIERLCRANRIRGMAASSLPASARASIPVGWEVGQWATYLVDLQQGEDALWKGLKNSARKAIRSAREDGVEVRRIDSLESLRDYYDFVQKCAAAQGRRTHGFADFETMWRHFRAGAIFETFVAEQGGEPIAGLSVWGYNGIIGELGSFASERGYREKLYGGDLIKWEVIRWGHLEGLRWFDLAGVNPSPQTPKERAIRQFKEKWGGRYSEYLLPSRKSF